MVGIRFRYIGLFFNRGRFVMKKDFLFGVWVCLLSALAGFMNVSAIFLYSVTVSHHTGNLSRLAINLYQGDMNMFMVLLRGVMCFVAGGVVCGYLFHHKDLKLRYGNGFLLIVSGIAFLIVLSWKADYIILMFITFLIGVQNAMYMFYKHVLIRTGHFTGYLSDIGFTIGRIIKGHTEDLELFLFYLFNIMSFIFGGYISALLINGFKINTLYVGAWLYIVLGIYYLLMKKNKVFE